MFDRPLPRRYLTLLNSSSHYSGFTGSGKNLPLVFILLFLAKSFHGNRAPSLTVIIAAVACSEVLMRYAPGINSFVTSGVHTSLIGLRIPYDVRKVPIAAVDGCSSQ